MQIEQLLYIRQNNYARDDYLIHLVKQNKRFIYTFSKKIASSFATPDIIRNECTQYFMLGANRGIDQAKIIDDGRGKNDPEKYIIYLGSQHIRDFLMREFRLNRKYKPEFSSLSEKENTIQVLKNYENELIGNIIIEEIVSKLKPLDRKILQLILYGETETQDIIPNIGKNKIDNNLVNTIANTLGYNSQYIYTRIYILRSVFSTLSLN